VIACLLVGTHCGAVRDGEGHHGRGLLHDDRLAPDLHPRLGREDHGGAMMAQWVWLENPNAIISVYPKSTEHLTQQGAAHVHVPHRDAGRRLDGAVRRSHLDRQEGHAQAAAGVAAHGRLQLRRLPAGQGGAQRPAHALPVPRRGVLARVAAVDRGLRLLRAVGGHRVPLVREAEGGLGARLERALRSTAAATASGCP
jgi:hypothetical protein